MKKISDFKLVNMNSLSCILHGCRAPQRWTNGVPRLLRHAGAWRPTGSCIGTAGNVSARVDDLVAITATGRGIRADDPRAGLGRRHDGPGGRGLAGADLRARAPSRHLPRLRRGRRRAHARADGDGGRAASSTCCPACTTKCCCSAVTFASPPTRRSARPKLAANVHAALDGRAAALMANHGAVTHAGDLAKAVELALLLEWACTVYWRAAAIGTPRSLDADAAGGRDRGRDPTRIRQQPTSRQR